MNKFVKFSIHRYISNNIIGHILLFFILMITGMNSKQLAKVGICYERIHQAWPIPVFAAILDLNG